MLKPSTIKLLTTLQRQINQLKMVESFASSKLSSSQKLKRLNATPKPDIRAWLRERTPTHA